MAILTPPPPIAANVLDGRVFERVWSGWFRNLYNVLAPGLTLTVALGPLTGGGTAGSLKIENGIVVDYVAPT